MWIFQCYSWYPGNCTWKTQRSLQVTLVETSLKNRVTMQKYIIMQCINTMYRGRVKSSNTLRAQIISMWKSRWACGCCKVHLSAEKKRVRATSLSTRMPKHSVSLIVSSLQDLRWAISACLLQCESVVRESIPQQWGWKHNPHGLPQGF